MENQEMNEQQEKLPENRELKSLEKEKLSVLEDYDFAYKGCRNVYYLSFLPAFLGLLVIILYESMEGLRPIPFVAVWLLSILFTSPIAFMNALWARKTFPLICSIIFSVWLAVLLIFTLPPPLFLILAFVVSGGWERVLFFLILGGGYYFWVFRFLWHLFVFYGKNLGKGISLEQAHYVYNKESLAPQACKCPEHPFYDKFATVFSVCTLLHVLAGAAFVVFVVLLCAIAIVTFFEALFSGTGISPSELLKMISESTPAS